MVQVILVLVLSLALLIAVFALQNQEMVDIRFFFWEISVSKILVILGSALSGALAVLLAGLFRRRAKERKPGGKAAAEDAPQKPAGQDAAVKQGPGAAGSEPPDRVPGKKDV